MSDWKDEIIYGRHPIIDAIDAGRYIDKIWLQIGIKGEFVNDIRQQAKLREIPTQMVPKDKMQKITKANHQGVIAFVSMVQFFQLEDVLPLVYEQNKNPLVLVLDGVTDVRNFGAIARSAECLGAQAIVVGKKNVARINAEAMKTSAGALSKIHVCRASSPMAAIEYLQMSGLSVFASDLKASKNIQEVDFTSPTALIIGAEDRGVHKSLLEKANETFIIPQLGTTDSLNVSVATGIMLYEVIRQRNLTK